MPGTVEGGRKARDKNLANNPNFYAEIGAKGGAASSTGGFASNTMCDCLIYPEEHLKQKCAGYKGGLISRRRKKVK